ncbi:GtrA family protein [Methanocella arvoryzae]|uniref:GtrA family protein n=1 Tax=Methanocella arvoryzae TaxID=1175445 RepID=UPI000324D219|nr:GtrA family protein [Methanocella arvoryzae]
MKDILLQAEIAISRFYPDYRKLVKSLMVGVLATLVDMAILFALDHYVGLFYIIAKIISYHVGMGVSFYLNKTFTFRNTYEKYHHQLASFALVAYSQMALTVALLFVLVQFIFQNDATLYVMIANVIVAFIGFIYAFTINKSVTFKIFK